MNEVEIIEEIKIPTKIKYKGVIWVPESKKECVKVNKINNVNKIDNNFTLPTEKPKHGNLKKPYIVKWIEHFEVGSVFTLNQFYRIYPKLKKSYVGRKNVDKIIVNLVQEGKINHWKRKGQFRVLK